MNIQISLATIQEKIILQNLMQYYLYEFSEDDGIELNELGEFVYPYLEHYWNEPDRYPFLIRVENQLAGFALLRRATYFSLPEDLPGMPMVVAEFFILKKDRRKGLGSQAARWLFDQFPGRWEIAQMKTNFVGQAFWRKVIGEYCRGAYGEVLLDDSRWKGPVQVFENSARFIDGSISNSD